MRTWYILIIAFFLTVGFASAPPAKTTIWLIGDSTMSIKDPKAYPETGWGMPFVHFWDSTVTVDNRAKNGRSTRSFRTEGLWKPVAENMKSGDYVFIQFGHNDEVSTKKTFTTETEFSKNLGDYIAEVKEKGATPILLTPVARRKFDSTGKIQGTHDRYSQLTRDVAAKEQVILIDLDRKSQALYQQFGVENSKWLFLQLKPGEHPNYPDGKDDNTHFSEFGARLIAQIVLASLREQVPQLAERINKPTKK